MSDPLTTRDTRITPVTRAPGPTDTAPIPVVAPGQFNSLPPQYGPPTAYAEPYGGPPDVAETPARRSPVVGYVLKGLGLLVVAVLSGTAWLALQPVAGKPVAVPSNAATGQFFFTKQPQQDTIVDCQAHSYANSAVQTFFATTPCQQATRALYTTTTVTDGAQVLVSLVVVHMPDANTAAQLRALVIKDNTGNLNDLPRETTTLLGPPHPVAYGGFASVQNGQVVTIAMSTFVDGRPSDPSQLTPIANDALRLGK